MKKKVKFKRKIDGMIINDSEVDKMFIYFIFGYYLHWTPKQVDETDAYTIDCMQIMLPLWKVKTQDVMNG